MILGPFCSMELDLFNFSIISNLILFSANHRPNIKFSLSKKNTYAQYLSFATLLCYVAYVGAM